MITGPLETVHIYLSNKTLFYGINTKTVTLTANVNENR